MPNARTHLFLSQLVSGMCHGALVPLIRCKRSTRRGERFFRSDSVQGRKDREKRGRVRGREAEGREG